eukprot:CFRG7771T1
MHLIDWHNGEVTSKLLKRTDRMIRSILDLPFGCLVSLYVGPFQRYLLKEMDDYEAVVLVKPEVYVYKIPPASARGYKAAEWGLDKWMWQGRLRILTKGKVLTIRLEDKTSGDLFAQAKLTAFPSEVITPANDSSRYFALRIEDDSGRHAYIGFGFADRGDAFDFNASIQDHFRWEKEEEKLRKAAPVASGPKKDYSMKDGQTIQIKFGKKTKANASSTPTTDDGFGAMGSFLPPPPPGGSKKNRHVASPIDATSSEAAKPAARLDDPFNLLG